MIPIVSEAPFFLSCRGCCGLDYIYTYLARNGSRQPLCRSLRLHHHQQPSFYRVFHLKVFALWSGDWRTNPLREAGFDVALRQLGVLHQLPATSFCLLKVNNDDEDASSILIAKIGKFFLGIREERRYHDECIELVQSPSIEQKSGSFKGPSGRWDVLSKCKSSILIEYWCRFSLLNSL